MYLKINLLTTCLGIEISYACSVLSTLDDVKRMQDPLHGDEDGEED